MLGNWLAQDDRIHLPRLFEHLGFELLSKRADHLLFKKAGRHYVVIYEEGGYRYYTVQRPQEKQSASHLVIEHISTKEGPQKGLLWDRVDRLYTAILNNTELLVKEGERPELEKVDNDFNHFHGYGKPLQNQKDMLYSGVGDLKPFTGRIFSNAQGNSLFPLFNLQNEVCGYLMDRGTGMVPYEESAVEHALWYSNVPKKIDGLFLFNDPKEALAFHRKFRLQNVVYLALGKINVQTTQILFQIQRVTKTPKLFLSFTGHQKIEGYLRDLHFISFVKESDFNLYLTDRDIQLRFSAGNPKSFSRLYAHIKSFNAELNNTFLHYNKIIDQNRINKFSIAVSKQGETITIRLPLETNAIKLFVWSYYKNYLDKTIEILKPPSGNWYSEWEQSKKTGEEVQVKEYRIAL